jgi:hypothetical protein
VVRSLGHPSGVIFYSTTQKDNLPRSLSFIERGFSFVSPSGRKRGGPPFDATRDDLRIELAIELVSLVN